MLVAVVNNQRDMEIARLLGWYRIPVRSAPKVVAVDYLAFYQTQAFDHDKWRIQYIAPVHGHELVTRAELLSDEPDHPNAKLEYFKIELGPLVRLPEPILATNWRRITFFYTTGEYLHKAKTVNDLVIQSDERQILWQSLRERASARQAYGVRNLPEMDIDPNTLAALLGFLQPEQ